MDESLSLSQQQKTQQRLAPIQLQYARMLEMTSIEIEDEVRRAVDDNPALEICDHDPQANNDEDNDFRESAEEMQRADYRDEEDIPSYRLEANNRSANDEYYRPEAVYNGNSIIETLVSQLSELDLDEFQFKIAQYIIGSIDDNGYLSRDLHQIGNDLSFAGIDVPYDVIKSAFEQVRSLDPPGIGAIDLRDCLLLQLRRLPSTPTVALATEIITDYFDLFSKKHYERLCANLNIDQDSLRDAIDFIRDLNPKPGSAISGSSEEERSGHIIPDFSVEVDGDNITLSLLNNVPELQIEETFKEISGQQHMSEREKQAQIFIKQKRDEARDFITTLKMRQETLFRVMSAIVKIQRNFFLTDDESLIRPMILKDIASLTGYNLAVISRATAGKYVATASGIYPLKLFFNERPKEDDDTSFHEIQAVLKEIISNESKRKPLSDEAITAILKERGYDIARRTVAKYRERMGIPVARLRKSL